MLIYFIIIYSIHHYIFLFTESCTPGNTLKVSGDQTEINVSFTLPEKAVLLRIERYVFSLNYVTYSLKKCRH